MRYYRSLNLKRLQSNGFSNVHLNLVFVSEFEALIIWWLVTALHETQRTLPLCEDDDILDDDNALEEALLCTNDGTLRPAVKAAAPPSALFFRVMRHWEANVYNKKRPSVSAESLMSIVRPWVGTVSPHGNTSDNGTCEEEFIVTSTESKSVVLIDGGKNEWHCAPPIQIEVITYSTHAWRRRHWTTLDHKDKDNNKQRRWVPSP